MALWPCLLSREWMGGLCKQVPFFFLLSSLFSLLSPPFPPSQPKVKSGAGDGPHAFFPSLFSPISFHFSHFSHFSYFSSLSSLLSSLFSSLLSLLSSFLCIETRRYGETHRVQSFSTYEEAVSAHWRALSRYVKELSRDQQTEYDRLHVRCELGKDRQTERESVCV